MASDQSGGLDYTKGIDSSSMGDGILDYGLMLPDYDNAKERKARDGIPNVLDKLERGERVTVGYIGGSITKQRGWRPRTTLWLKSRFPDATITEVDAAISGTGADLGAARIDGDLLVHRPDLVFVEFVVNGAGLRDVEGLVRKVWKADPYTDICFVYTLKSDWVASYAPGSTPSYSSSLVAFETVAEHYGIPSIFFGYVLGELYTRGRLAPKADEPVDSSGKIAFTKDGVHPLGTGDQLYAGAAARSILSMQRLSGRTAAHDLKAPLDPHNWEKATTRDAADFAVGLEQLDTDADDFGQALPYAGLKETIRQMYPRLVKMATPGDSMTVSFEGTVFGIADVGGPFSGRLGIVADGRAPVSVERFVKYNSYLRHQYFFLPEMEHGRHTVTLTLLPGIADKREIVQNKADYDRDPDAYKRGEVYIGKVIVVGNFVEADEKPVNE